MWTPHLDDARGIAADLGGAKIESSTDSAAYMANVSHVIFDYPPTKLVRSSGRPQRGAYKTVLAAAAAGEMTGLHRIGATRRKR
jgi:hypothetical protein